MPVDVPRRPPLTGPERERNARNANGVQVAGGATGSARALRRTDTAQPWTHDVPDGGTTGQVLTKASDDDYAADWEDATGAGIIATGSFDASDTSGFTGASYQVDFDHDRGSAPGVWQSNVSGQGIDVLVAGAFNAHASANIGDADPGDVFKMMLENGGGGDGYGIGYGIADAVGNADLSAHCATGFALSAPVTPLFTVTLIQISGTGTAPTLGGVFIDLQQVSWNGN